MSVLPHAAQAGRHRARHEPRARRAPHARPSAQLLRQALQRSSPTASARTTSGSTTTSFERLADEHKPKLIMVGASAYPRVIDFARVAEVAARASARSMVVDMAHIAGLVAGGVHPSPVPHADFVTTTTHKTLRGPRGGMVLCRAQYAKDLDRRVFPGVQGGPLMHIIAAKAVCFKEAAEPDIRRLSAADGDERAAAGRGLAAEGFRLVSGGTDNHLMLVDVFSKGITGKVAEQALGQGGHHRQQERHSLRSEPADGGQRHPARDAGVDDARDEGSRDGPGGRRSSRACSPSPEDDPRARRGQGRGGALCRKFPLVPDQRRDLTIGRRRAVQRGRSARARAAAFEPRAGQRAMALARRRDARRRRRAAGRSRHRHRQDAGLSRARHPERPARAHLDRHQEPAGADLLQGPARARARARSCASRPPT